MPEHRLLRRGRRPRAFMLAGAALLLAAVASGDVVVKDHITLASLWNNTLRISNWDDSTSTIDFFGAGAFTGNGGDLLQVEGIFWSVSSSGVPNGAVWANIDFRLVFYADTNAFQTDPRNGSQVVIIDTPSNASWMTPVTSFVDPGDSMTYNLHRFTFDLSAQGIATTAGVEQLVAITPTGNSLSDGQTGMMYSTGGAGSVGAELDRWARIVPKTGPDTLQSLGAPHHYLAYRVTLADAPCPADLDDDGGVGVLDLLDLLGAWGPNPGHPADFDGNGSVDVLDLLELLGAWGSCP